MQQIAELSSSRSGVKASLSSNKPKLEASRQQIAELLQDCAAKSKEIQAGLDLQEEMKNKCQISKIFGEGKTLTRHKNMHSKEEI